MSNFACLYIFQKHSYAVEKVSFLLKPEDDLFDFLQIKKKLAHNKERSDLLHSNYGCCYFLCIYTENNCYIIQNACA